MQKKVFNKGDVIFKKGDFGEEMYRIDAGSVDIIDEDQEDRAQALVNLVPGKYFGELAVIDGCPRSANAVAAEDGTEVLEISVAEFFSYFDEAPDEVINVLRQLCERLREMTNDYLEAAAVLSELELADSTKRKGLSKKLMDLVKGKNYKANKPSAEATRKRIEGFSSQIEAYPIGTIICKQGEIGHCMYDIQEGMAGVYTDFGTDKAKKLTTLAVNDFFGELGMLGDEPRSATVVAESDVVLELISLYDLKVLFQKNPNKVQMILEHITKRLRTLTNSYTKIAEIANELSGLEDGAGVPEELQADIDGFKAKLYE